MKRRSFLNLGLLAAVSTSLGIPARAQTTPSSTSKKQAKNIIFLVSDGMSLGTLTMADLLLQRKYGHPSFWLNLYRQGKGTHALVDTASADSLVTDSAAGSSSWGCGIRVKNGFLNITPDGRKPKTILQKFKEGGKATGCVTTVTITHATPAGFCVNEKSRGNEAGIAASYFDRKFDVMMGGGTEFFSSDTRKDKRDLFGDFAKSGYQVARTKAEMNAAKAGKPLLGVFTKGALPYSLDRVSNPELMEKTPTLAEMETKAIEILSANPNGFVLQVEGGKVDWAAHGNDVGALVYDQIAFDEAIATALRFAESNGETLVIMTTDHGNSNPGLIKCKKVNACFDTLQHFKHTNEWVLKNIQKTDSPDKVISLIKENQGFTVTKTEAADILTHYSSLKSEELYNAYKLPFRRYAEIQKTYTSVGWSGMDHSADYGELGMYGPFSETLPPFIKNVDLHNFMLRAAGFPTNA